ncbi:MAG: sensor histidine kinase [Clostridia bacterium]|nr:sensor histidine kinase [Clostridia bacterium]
MTQFEFYKSFLFVIELLVAEFLFVYRFRRRSHFSIRAVLGVVSVFVFAFFLPTNFNNAFYFSVIFLLIFLYTIIVCKVLFKESLLTVLFCCLAGYTTQHLTYELYNSVLIFMDVSASSGFYGQSNFWDIFPNLFVFVVYVCLYVASYFACYFLFSCKLQAREEISIQTPFILIFTAFILVVDIVLNAITVYSAEECGRVGVIIIGVYNVLCCLVSLYLQFEVALRRKIEKNFDALQEIWNAQKKQYAISKENIELINMKCHDFKHQIHTLGKHQTVSPVALKELEDSISIYDSIVKTGNDALDIILTEKSLLCNKENIQFSCIVDGEKLNFIKTEDVYALFGNIVDNAIEAVLKVPPSKRIISLRVKTVDNMLVVNASNYYKDAVVYKYGEIQTTKEEKDFHGFGIRSIQYVCERYGGEMTITAENNIFSLTLLFFINEEK